MLCIRTDTNVAYGIKIVIFGFEPLTQCDFQNVECEALFYFLRK